MDKKKDNNGILKSLKHAALVAFGGAALIGAGFGAQKAVTILTPPPSVTEMAERAPERLPEGCEQTLQSKFAGQNWQQLSLAAARGDGHPVIVIPGFMTNDLYMASLRGRISEQGYAVYGWGEGMNFGASQDDAENLLARVREVSREHGGQKVSLVGYSLGGIYARELARAHPELIRDVITLGAPFGLRDWSGAPDQTVERIQGFYSGNAQQDVIRAPSVPTTSIYSKDDFFVAWQNSLNPRAPNAENVPVTGGHVTMPFNDQAAAVVINRLSQEEGKWQPLWVGTCQIPGARLASGF